MSSSTRWTHPVNVAYLVVGLVFLGIAGSWGLRAADVVDTGEIGWLLPLTLVAAGAIGLVAFAAKGLARGRHDDEDGDGYLLEDTTRFDTSSYDASTIDTEGEHR